MQTITGHNGSVLSLGSCADLLASCSTDGTVRLWKADDGNHLLLNPWFMPAGVFDLSPGPEKVYVFMHSALGNDAHWHIHTQLGDRDVVPDVHVGARSDASNFSRDPRWFVG
jgi:WD40 repeat protein